MKRDCASYVTSPTLSQFLFVEGVLVDETVDVVISCLTETVRCFERGYVTEIVIHHRLQSTPLETVVVVRVTPTLTLHTPVVLGLFHDIRAVVLILGVQNPTEEGIGQLHSGHAIVPKVSKWRSTGLEYTPHGDDRQYENGEHNEKLE